LLLLFLKRS
jgi:chemotaxis protein histidine kinase CheA